MARARPHAEGWLSQAAGDVPDAQALTLCRQPTDGEASNPRLQDGLLRALRASEAALGEALAFLARRCEGGPAAAAGTAAAGAGPSRGVPDCY